MVLFKRKPVKYLPHPQIDDQDSDVWVVSWSNEVFTSYDAYLERMDFFKSKRFTCEVSGRSGLTFFDALRSEQAGSREIDEAFPQALREPVLRRVQFSTISRIDNLVEDVFNDFKNDFYPGELVTVILDDASRLNGRVRDKAKFAEVKAQDGSVAREAFSRYFVRLVDRPDEEALVDDNHIARDRKVFTKQMLRSFIKNTVTREGWNGAPWLVKPEIAERFRIDTNVPPHLQYGNKVAAKKAEKKRDSEQGDGMFGVWQTPKLPALKPAAKGRKNQQVQQQQNIEVHIPPPYYDNYPPQHMHDPGLMPRSWDHMQAPPPPPGWDPYYQGHGYPQHMPPNGHYYPPPQMPPQQPVAQPVSPPPPIKYPIDDLDIDPVRDGTHRPTLKFITKQQCNVITTKDHVIPSLRQETVGLLLETWNTLNVYCQVLKLDSFTFDDFVEAMMFSSTEVDCDLLVEAHCAVLKQLVNSENVDEGAIQISLPDLPDPDDNDEEEDEAKESRAPTPTPEPEYPAKRTRSSLNKVQFAEPEPEPDEDVQMVQHRAAEMNVSYGWVERLQKRDLEDGGWELVMVGLLHQLSGRPKTADLCHRILTHLAPLDADATIDTARHQYATMDINMRAEALQIICQLFLETKTVKNFLEEMSNTMTQYRKVKIEHQRARKEAIAKLKELQVERRLLAPEPEKSPTPMPELEEAMENAKVEDEDMSIPDSEDDDPVVTRSLRRGADRAAERKRKRDQEQERREKAAEAKQTKGSKEYQKVLRQIEKEREKIDQAEEQIIVVDGDLREADCPRTRMLGMDRFCNRYWWFERNAMPYGGLPDSSTADAEYVNGRIWVQGPDDMELEGFIDLSEPDKQAYFRRFQMTPAERKVLEEGSTNLKSAKEWGFYETAEELDMLIGWLDARGHRELKLKKELNMHRDLIIKHMEKRTAYLAPREESEEPQARMSSRTKVTASDKRHRCLRWKNSTALAELGHRHVDPVPKPRARGRKNVTYEDERVTRTSTGSTKAAPLNRQGKPVTRQGARYNF